MLLQDQLLVSFELELVAQSRQYVLLAYLVAMRALLLEPSLESSHDSLEWLAPRGDACARLL